MADESIITTLGLRTTEFSEGLASTVTQAEAAQQRINAALGASGVNIADEPQKYAAASAKAFEEVYASEEKLAEFRAQTAFKRMSDEEKLALFQSQAATLQSKIASFEGETAEKNALILDFEKKKAEVYDLNQKIKTDSLATTKSETDSLGKQTGIVDSLKGGFNDIGIAIKGAGIGIIIAEVISLGKEAISNAQKTRDAYEAIGKPLDNATRTMAAFGDALDSTHKGAVSMVGYVVGGFTQLFDLEASIINRMRGISEAEENIAVAAYKGAEAQEARLAKLQQEQHDVDKIASARKAYADAEKAAATAGQTDQQKLNTLLAEHARIADQIRIGEAGTVAYWERKKFLADNEKATADLRLQIQQKEKETADKIAANEDAIAKSKRQNQTTSEQLASIDEQIATHMTAAAQAGSDRLKYTTEEATIVELLADRTKLVAAQHEKMALSMSDEIDLYRLQQKSLTGLSQSEQSRLDLLRLQKQEKQTMVEIEELEKRNIDEGLAPAEQARFDALLRQDQKLQDQIDKKKQLISEATTQATAEAAVTDQYAKQLDALNRLAAAHGSPDAANGLTTTVEQLQSALDTARAHLETAKNQTGDVSNEQHFKDIADAQQRVTTLENAVWKARTGGQTLGGGTGQIPIKDLGLEGLTAGAALGTYGGIQGGSDYTPSDAVLALRAKGQAWTLFNDLYGNGQSSTLSTPDMIAGGLFNDIYDGSGSTTVLTNRSTTVLANVAENTSKTADAAAKTASAVSKIAAAFDG